MMERILVVVRDPIDGATLRERCLPRGREPVQIAVCHVLEPEEDGLEAGLRAQRRMTTALRQALGEGAEDVPVFVASGRPGDTVEDCARAWGATLVRP